MGTNYYLKPDAGMSREVMEKLEDLSDECRNKPDSIHIGKSSWGWCFSLHVYPKMGVHDLEDWKPLLKAGVIYNEYDDKIEYSEMMSTITERSHPHSPEDLEKKWREEGSVLGYRSYEDFLKRNHASPGPNNLVRHRVEEDGYCIKNGNGTWDCMVGEFS
jgi:hypothetical protein